MDWTNPVVLTSTDSVKNLHQFGTLLTRSQPKKILPGDSQLQNSIWAVYLLLKSLFSSEDLKILIKSFILQASIQLSVRVLNLRETSSGTILMTN